MANEDLLRSYLLGQVALENIDCLGESLHRAETDLIDSYVRQELSEEERGQFESHFLQSEERFMRVQMARLLMSPEIRSSVSVSPIEEQRATRAPWWQLLRFRIALATAGLAALVVAAFLLVQHNHLPNQSAQSKSAQTGQQQAGGASQQPPSQASAPSHPQTSFVASFMLTPETLRGVGGQQNNVLKLPAGITEVDLMLRLESHIAAIKYSHFDVVLETAEGGKLQTLQNLSSERVPDGGIVVRTRFPTKVLAEGDYILDLLGRTASSDQRTLGSYSFSVAGSM